ncbi:tripartite motif-containing protein 2-like [Ptychodera flava]|uniref:tripartite motif-containing protein 2-like n=1 Tax=Ptychodera flava TaxID=63121 RepID=UPI003969C7F0
MASEQSNFFDVVKENFLCCCVCSERYKSAKVLPCTHTFCEQCLIKILEKSASDQLTCPICRRSHKVSARGVSELPANLFVNQLVELFEEQDEKTAAQRNCEACETAEVTERCIDCSVSLCGICSKAHRFLPATRSHRLIAIDEYEKAKFNNPASVRPPPHCSKHHENVVKFYCDTCKVSICLECAAVDHPRPEHKFRYLDEAAAEFKHFLTAMTKDLRIKENEASVSKSAVQQMVESVDSRFKEEKQKVRAHTEKTIEETTREMRENGEGLLHQLNIAHEKRKSDLQSQLKDLECTENDIAATRDYANTLMQYGNTSQLMSAKKSITSKIWELINVTTECEPVVDDHVEFQPADFCVERVLGTLMTAMHSYELRDVPKYWRVGEQMTVRLIVRSRERRSKIKEERITAVMTTTDERTFILTVRRNQGGTFSLTNTLKTTGPHELSVSVDGKEVRGSPVTVTLGPQKGAMRAFGGYGSGIGQLSGPRGVIITKNESIIVADENNKRLQTFILQGGHQVIHKFTEIAYFRPRYCTVSEDGNIFTTDGGNNQVVVCDENGEMIRCFGKGKLKDVYGIAIGPHNGYVYVVDYSLCCVQIYSQSGNCIKRFGSKGNGVGQFRGPLGVAVENREGKVFVSDYGSHSVKAFDAHGRYLFSFGSKGSGDGQLNYPEGICSDQHGHVYVCDYNNRVQKFTSSGAFICPVHCGAEAMQRPVGVCVTGEEPFQKIIIAEQNAQRIRVVEL